MMRKVTEGISVKKVGEDAMSKRQVLLVTIPKSGPFPAPETVLLALDQLREGEPRTLAQANEVVLSPSIAEESKTLANADFLAAAQRQISNAMRVMPLIPGEYQSLVSSALNEAFRAGVSVSTMRTRERFLRDVTMQAKMKAAQREGGESRKGVFKDDTEELVTFMAERISKGHSMTAAGQMALTRSKKDGGPMGTSAHGNRERYRSWLKRERTA